jgi:hypothetical protein
MTLDDTSTDHRRETSSTDSSPISNIENLPFTLTQHYNPDEIDNFPEETYSKYPPSQLTCSIIVQLRTGHAPLNAYLYRFGHYPSPLCDHSARRELHREIAELNRTRKPHPLIRALDLQSLLSHPDALPLTARFFFKTGRFNSQ